MTEYIGGLAEIAGIAGVEVAIIDAETNVRDFKQTLRNNQLAFHIASGPGTDMETRATRANRCPAKSAN